MNQLSLDEVRHIEFEILRHFKGFCEKNGIRYYLSNGTLLGAVKYGGFIPWDDDIDVFVPRKDYERLLNLYQDDEKYVLFSFEKNKEFLFPFAKLSDATTRKEEFNTFGNVSLGVDIDIFPLDWWSDNICTAKKEVAAFNRHFFLLNLAKSRKAMSTNRMKMWLKACVIALFRLLNIGAFEVKKMIKLAKKHDGKYGNFVGCRTWAIYGEREIIPAQVFSESVNLKFRSESFSVPKGYDVYLRSLYGDYTKDPPPEEQKTHHNFVAYRL